MTQKSITLSIVSGVAALTLGAFALPVLAQEAPAQAAAPAQPPADAAPAAAAPVAVAEAPKPAEPPPVLPTTGDGAVITRLLTQVCKPLVAGGNFEALVKAAGMRLDSRSDAYVLPLSQRPYQISMSKPGSNNRNVCEMTVRYAPGWDQPIIDSLNIWRFLEDPQLRGKRNDQAKYSDLERVTTTWDNWENQSFDGKMIGLALVQLNKLDGTPSMNPNYDEAIVVYNVRAALPAAASAQAAPASPPAQPAS